MDKCGTEICSFWAVFFVFFLLPAFKNQELSVNIQIPSLSENTQKTTLNASMAIILLLRTAPPHNLPVTAAP